MKARRTTLDAIAHLRLRYLEAMACQVVHDSLHARGFTELYALSDHGYLALLGYGDEPKDILREAFGYGDGDLLAVARELGGGTIQAQTNDPFLNPWLEQAPGPLKVDAFLFADGPGHAAVPQGFRELTEEERRTAFSHELEPVGTHGIEIAGRIVATGGVLTHYNPPFADLYMEVDATYRGYGLGAGMVAGLRAVCRSMGRAPAARCDPANAPSRAALLRGGMTPCGELRTARL